MKPIPKHRHTVFVSRFRRYSVISAMVCLLGHSAPAEVITWSGGGADDNWTTSANWSSGLPAGNDVVFSDFDATGTAGPSGAANNVVNENTAVALLKFTNLQPGNHTTEISAGVTLTVNGGGTSIEVQSPTTGTSDVVYATILGGGKLAMDNAASTLYVGQGAASANTTRRATLDLSGLEEFSGSLGQIVIGRQGATTQPNRSQGTLRLARSNTLDLSGNPGILLGNMIQNAGTGANAQILELGVSNTIRSNNGMTIGGRKGNGYLRFNSEMVGEGEGSAVFRNLSGDGPQGLWAIGDNNAQNGGTNNATGVVDFSLRGEVDALVQTIILGRANGSATASGTAPTTAGTLTFDKGIIHANALTAGIQPIATSGPTRGTVNVDGTGKLLVTGNVILGRQLSASHNSQGLLNIGAAAGNGEIEIRGDVVCGTGTGNTVTVHDGGVLRLGGILGRLGGENDQLLETLDLDSSSLIFDLGAAGNPDDSRANVQTLRTAGMVNLSISGSNLAPGTITLIDYGVLEGDGFSSFQFVPPAGIEGVLVHNTVQGSIDLEITGLTGAKWSGAVNGNWDINGTMNWKLEPGGGSITYQESGGSGPRAIFDDTASGTKNVNLTTTVSPLETVVETSQTYTFNGSGRLSGAGGLVKQGSGTLVLENSGGNDFSGGITIEGGMLRLVGADDRLPAGSTVTLADVPGAQLDLGGNNQTLAALAGGGTSGGNVLLGTGTLTLSGAGTYGGVIQGSGGLVKTGTGNQVLAGANTFSGGTTITSGRFTVANATGSGLGGGPIVIAAGGTLAIGDGNDTGSIAAATLTNDGLVVFNRSDEITLDTEITGAGGLNKNGAGTLMIHSAQTYGGVTNVFAGALQVSHPDALGAATSVLVDGTIVNNTPSSRLELSGGITLAEPIRLAQKQSVAGDVPCLINLAGDNTLTGPLQLNSGGSFWNIWSDDGKLTIAGPVTNITSSNTRWIRLYGEGDGEILSGLADGAAAGALTAVEMNGNGTWRLAGDNTYSGPTLIKFGTLEIDGSHTASPVTAEFGATLGGSGTLGTVIANGVIAPGSGIGTLRAAEVTLTGLLAIDVLGSSADRLTVSGTLDLTGSAISVTGTPTAGTYILASAGTLIGMPVLEDPVPGYALVVEDNMVKLNSLGGLSPYESWAGGEAFGDDANGDGVSNGLAFLLGAANPSVNALGLLPTSVQSSGGLVLNFKMRNVAARGGALLRLQHSSDLGITDAWTTVTVPDASSGPLSGVNFTVTPGDPLNDVQATISVGEASGGRLFGRLQGQNP